MWCDNPFSQRNRTTERKEGNSLWVGCEFGLFPSGFFLAISTTLSFQTKKLNSKYFVDMGLCGPKVSTKVSTISFIISNITVLVSHKCYLLCLFYSSEPWCQQEGSSNCLPHRLTRFSSGLFVALQEILYWPCFVLIRLQKIMHFQNKTILSTYCWSILILLFCVFLRVLLSHLCYHETINNLLIFAYMHSFLFGLPSNHVA